MKELNELTEFVKKQSRTVAENEEHAPMLFVIVPGKDEIAVVSLGGFDKNRFRSQLSMALSTLGATAYVLVNEGWVAKFDKTENSPWLDKLLKGEISVSELPPDDRLEILVITAVENGKSYTVWQAKIDYTTQGERLLGQWEKFEDNKSLSGRLVLKSW